jgi:ABC-type branched-subunit amino acid transport system ATPase component
MKAGFDSSLVLRLRGLVKAYGEVKAVDGLSLEVRRGEIFGFLGPNGAGKTTTIRMMCGLLAPDSGMVEINGRRGPSLPSACGFSGGAISRADRRPSLMEFSAVCGSLLSWSPRLQSPKRTPISARV